MIKMYDEINKEGFIHVDEWDTPEHPIAEEDRIFRNIRGEIILPIHELFGNPQDGEQARQLDYFAMNPKRSYNSDVTREHICRYLNYFEKFYDTEKELLMVMYEIKINIDYMHNYSVQNFMDDVNRYIIRNLNLTLKIRRFVDDNYLMKLSSNNRTPNLQFNNSHAKILYEISLLTNMYIPLATHYMYIHFIKASDKILNFMLELFDMAMVKYEEERGIYIFDKLLETAISVVNKSKNPDQLLWEKNLIRGNNTTTHARDSVNDIILQILPKYEFSRNIVSFNYFANRRCLQYKITDISYEFNFSKLSSSKRDSDQNSEYDRI